MAVENRDFTLTRNKSWSNRVAADNFKIYKDHKSVGYSWRENAIKLENARYGRQHSPSEEAMLLKFRQAPLAISAVTAICDTADAMMVSSKPSVYVAPIMYPFDEQREQTSRSVAKLYNHLLQKAWYDSLGNLSFDKAVEDYTNVGHGLLYVVPRHEYGEFSVNFEHLSWRYFYPDPTVTDRLYRRADNLVYAMGVSKKWAYKFVKSLEPDITLDKFEEHWARGSDVTERVNFEEDLSFGRPALPTQELVMFVQRLTLEEEYVYLVAPKVVDINQGNQELNFRTYTELTPELIELRDAGRIILERKRQFYVSEYTSIGNLGYKVTYPISEYNIVPLVYDHRGTPYPYSRMWYLYPLQRALNRFIMSSILNMSLLNSTRILAEEDSIVNEKQWQMDSSLPGAILKYRLPTIGFSKPPIVIEGKPMSEAWLHMPRYLTYMMEFISGIYSTMMGDPTAAPDVFSTVAALHSAGGLKIKRRMMHADATLSTAGRVGGEFFQHYAPLNGFSVNYIPGNEPEITKYNQVGIKEELNEKGEKSRKAIIVPETDLRIGFRDVRFTSAASSGYEAATETTLLTHLATQLGIPQLASPIIKRMNIEDADKIAETIDGGMRLAAENEELQKQVTELTRGYQMKLRQIEQAGVNLQGAIAKGKFDKEVEKFKSNPKKYIEDSLSSKETKETTQ